MKYKLIFLSLFIAVINEVSFSHAFVLSPIISGTPVAGGTPRASFALDSQTGGQVWDSVGEQWVGSGCATSDFTSGYLVADADTDRCLIPASFFDTGGGETAITIEYDWQVEDNFDNKSIFLYLSESGKVFTARAYTSVNARGSVTLKGGGVYPNAYWSQAPTNDTWYTTVIQLDFSTPTIAVTVDGGTPTGYNETNEASIVDQGPYAGNMYLGYIDSGGTKAVRLKNLNIYDGIVTP